MFRALLCRLLLGRNKKMRKEYVRAVTLQTLYQNGLLAAENQLQLGTFITSGG
jgi:hypothetical protein